MQLASTKGQESCTDVKPRFAWTDEEISAGFACSHGTVIWLRMTVAEATAMAHEILDIANDIVNP